MAWFRQKPVEVEAVRATESEDVETLEGALRVNPGDWIITGVRGERYPCRDDIFRDTYEAVAEDGQALLDA